MKKIYKKIVRKIKNLAITTLGMRIFKNAPRGLDFTHDAQQIPWAQTPEIILDVGANIGQSARSFAKAFPQATIHSFEPSDENYEKLKKKTAKVKRISCHNLGVTRSSGTAMLMLSERPTMHRIGTPSNTTGKRKKIKTISLDDFLRRENIDHVEILKVDTEGHDLEVLMGALKQIQEKKIDLIYCEASMNTENIDHAYFEDIFRLMTEHGYLLFGVYEQKHEWVKKKPYLRRANIAFISPKLAHRSTD